MILITGGTGTLGRLLVKKVLECEPKVVRVFDIDETKQFHLQQEIEQQMPWVAERDLVRYLIGDVKEEGRIMRAMEDVDIVFHLAGLKHVPSCEYNPFEAVKTNVLGTQNVINAALYHNVAKVIFTSSDKAAYPYNTMGATKLLAERLITSSNYARGSRRTCLASVRFGNVMGTRGSVIPLFKKQILTGDTITITDPDMTRFMMLQEEAIRLILLCGALTQGGELFVMKMPCIRIRDLADIVVDAIAPAVGKDPKKIRKKIVGLRAGETSYEELMTEEEASRGFETSNLFIVPPALAGNVMGIPKGKYPGKPIKLKRYDSKTAYPLTKEEVSVLLHGGGLI